MSKIAYRVERDTFNSTATLGKLYQVSASGKKTFVAHTLEDVLRPAGVKVDGKTCIDNGKYDVVVDVSTRFKREMCHVLNVPRFTGIRIHGGNDAVDTHGCLLVAKNRLSDTKIQGTLEAVVTAAVKAAGGATIEYVFADGVTPVYQTDVNAGA